MKMQTRLLLLGSLLLFVFACGKKDKPTAPAATLNISGTFVGTGMSTTSRTVNFEIVLNHTVDNVTGNNVNGTGSYRLSGSVTEKNFTVTGYAHQSGNFGFNFTGAGIIFSGSGASAMRLPGELSGIGIQATSATFVRK